MKHKPYPTLLLAVCLSTSLVSQSVHAAKGGNGKPGGGGGGGGSDTTPPAQITDLVAFNDANSGHFITLQWTTVGDDGNVGTAASYDLRYSTSPIVTQADWESSTSVPVVRPPLEPGNPQYTTIRGLASNSTFYVGLQAIDDAGNASPVSNIASAATAAADWILENLGTDNIHGSSIAFDPLDGTPTIAYADRTRAEFIYLHETSLGWDESTIASIENGSGSSIAFEFSPDRLPALGLSSVFRNLHYSIWNPSAGSWDFEWITEKGSLSGYGYAIDPTDNEPSFVYITSIGKGKNTTTAVIFAHRTNQGWVSEMVDSENIDRLERGLAFSPDGTAWIAYAVQDTSGQNSLNVVKRELGSSVWNVEKTFAAPILDEPTLAINPVTAEPVVTFQTKSGSSPDEVYEIIYAHRVNGFWTSEVVASTPSLVGFNNWPSVSFDSSGKPVVSFVSYSEITELVDVTVGNKGDSSEWHYSVADRVYDLDADAISIAVDPATNLPMLVYPERLGVQVRSLIVGRAVAP